MPTLLGFLLQKALTDYCGPWQNVYRYLRCTFHFTFGFAHVSIKVTLCVQIQSLLRQSTLLATRPVRPSSIVNEELAQQGTPRHRCPPFQVEVCGRCQLVLSSRLCSRAATVYSVRPQGPWQLSLASTLRPRFESPGSCPERRFRGSRYLDPASRSFGRLPLLTIFSPILLARRTTLFFASLLCSSVIAGQVL